MRSQQALRRARRAYELAHAIAGLRALAFAGAIVVLATLLYPVERSAVVVASVVLATVATASWRGGAWRRGSRIGLAVAAPALVMPPFVAAVIGCEPCSVPATVFLVACFASGTLSGFAIASKARSDDAPFPFMIAASMTALLTSLLGCDVFGLGGAVGAMAGITSSVVFATKAVD